MPVVWLPIVPPAAHEDLHEMDVDAAVEASPLSGGFGIERVEEGSPAAHMVAAQHLFLTDVVTKINGVNVVGKAGSEGAVRKANDFGDELSLIHI